MFPSLWKVEKDYRKAGSNNMYCTTMYMLWFSLNSSAPSESELVILPEFATRVTPTKQIAREAQSVLCYKSIEFGR